VQIGDRRTGRPEAVLVSRFFVAPMNDIPEYKRLPKLRCSECLRPLNANDRDAEGNPDVICEECKYRRALQRQVAKWADRAKRDVKELMVTTVRNRVHLPQLNFVVAKLLEAYGGTDEFVKLVKFHVDNILMDDNASHRQKLEAIKFLTHFIQAGMADHRMEMNVTAMSDKDIAMAIDSFIERRLADHLRVQSVLPQGNGNNLELVE